MSKKDKKPLTPASQVVVVDSVGRQEMDPSKVRKSIVGEKAFGLACLPKSWTPPWFILSSDCFKDYSSALTKEKKKAVLSKWSAQCVDEIQSSELSYSEKLIIRSSGTNETLKDRGKFYSKIGDRNDFKRTLEQCLEENLRDPDSHGQRINFVVQSYVEPREKGHLSNERRCSKEQRDWLGEIEKTLYSEPFKVNYRRWRTEIEAENAAKEPIKCSLSINLQKCLTNVAAWAQSISSRLHFEWVWNGRLIYLVQVESEIVSGSFNPTNTSARSISPEANDLKVFREIKKSDAQKYRKIKNVFVYLDLDLPIVAIYILDKKEVLEDLSKGVVSEDIKSDIRKLVKTSLIIRTDISSKDQQLLQMLPRSEELRSEGSAIDWLIKNSKSLLRDVQVKDSEIAFICHNFIPAESAAFAFASPGERKVQIESLWGIPEGLYYNSHDKFVVDTLDRKIENAVKFRPKYKFLKKIQFKNYCVAPDHTGEWKMQEIAPPYDWRPSIRKEQWLSYIALNSRRIAEHEQIATSVMWFVGLTAGGGQPELIPWFHEECHAINPHSTKRFHQKTPQDKVFDVKYEDDIDDLIQQLSSNSSNITHIRVKPVEERLLREKATLQRIGKIAKESNKVILLEGATLSHAYYQLVQVGALVQAEAWFDEDTEVKEFHKLVRDNVPYRISDGGERVDISTLKGDSLNRALKEKLVEEAIEVLDAKNYDSLLEELADVQEVIQAIVRQVGSSPAEVSKIQADKRRKLGGFAQGLVLHGTSNPSIQSMSSHTLSLDLGLSSQENAGIRMTTQGSIRTSTSWKDKRHTENAEELLVNFVVPVLEDSWSVESQDLRGSLGQSGLSKAKLKGSRTAGKLRIELSLYTAGPQLELFED